MIKTSHGLIPKIFKPPGYNQDKTAPKRAGQPLMLIQTSTMGNAAY